MTTILCQRFSGGGKFATPYDSTVGVGPGFYWFGLLFLLFIAGGTLKAYWDDKKWNGKVYKLKDKKRNKH
ncbi:MAG: hypothetical protein MUF39_10615 [Cyclobacteriaceae bacterium]|jgi:hypothetical protein|nr:hypothetical protein [Cyclobacteriaceae bacterium]